MSAYGLIVNPVVVCSRVTHKFMGFPTGKGILRLSTYDTSIAFFSFKQSKEDFTQVSLQRTHSQKSVQRAHAREYALSRHHVITQPGSLEEELFYFVTFQFHAVRLCGFDAFPRVVVFDAF